MEFLGSLMAVAAALAPGAAAGVPSVPPSGAEIAQVAPGEWLGDWIVEEADNVCGLTDPRQIQKPARVDYDELLRATPESKEMRRRGIDKDSPEGQVLHNKAVDRIRTASARVIKDLAYDSVWKKIRHREGRQAPNITADVLAKLDFSVGG